MAARAARRAGSRASTDRPRATAMPDTAARPAITIATTTNALAGLRMPASLRTVRPPVAEATSMPDPAPRRISDFAGFCARAVEGGGPFARVHNTDGRHAAVLRTQPRVEQVAQPVTEQVDAEHGQEEG